MAPRKKSGANNQGKQSSRSKQPNLVDQLSTITTLDEDELFVSFDSNVEVDTPSAPQHNGDSADIFKPSRIPKLSPRKPSGSSSSMGSQNSLSLREVNEDIEKLFKQRDASKLLELNHKLRDDVIKGLESKYEAQLARANKLIEKLMIENDSLKLQLVRMESDTITSPQPSKSSENDSSVIFDIIELLTNLSCLEFLEDDEKMQFILKQVGTDAEIKYRLIINKSEKMDEITYIPILPNTGEDDQDDEEDDDEDEEDDNIKKKKKKADMISILRKRLPDYLFDEVHFPSSSLNSFYNKINKSLNKPLEKSI